MAKKNKAKTPGHPEPLTREEQERIQNDPNQRSTPYRKPATPPKKGFAKHEVNEPNMKLSTK